MALTPRLLDERAFTGSLLRLARIYRREVNRVLAEHDLSDARALPVLHIARSGGGMRQGHLAEELGVEGPSLVRILDQLCAAGLVERRDDPKDGRAKTLHLTAEGDALAVVVEDAVQELRTKLLAGISAEDLAATVRTFVAFEAALEAADNPSNVSGQEG
ncbi:MAG: MarR family transcriptional regulator [Caulobacter sp.]|nr:MarR family transcriptional regulator [Caulobacter sp.]